MATPQEIKEMKEKLEARFGCDRGSVEFWEALKEMYMNSAVFDLDLANYNYLILEVTEPNRVLEYWMLGVASDYNLGEMG